MFNYIHIVHRIIYYNSILRFKLKRESIRLTSHIKKILISITLAELRQPKRYHSETIRCTLYTL